MADLQVKQESLEEVPCATTIETSSPNPSIATQNHWMTTRATPKRRKAIPKKRPMTNSYPSSHSTVQRRRLIAKDCQPFSNNSDFHGYAENGQARSTMFGEYRSDNWEVSERTSGVNVIAKLQAELEEYKRENKQLKKKLADAINIGELQKTLRMTLHSFGVPIPKDPSEHVCSCSTNYEIPSQPGHGLLSPNHEEYDHTLTDYEEAYQSQQRNTNRQGHTMASSSGHATIALEHPITDQKTQPLSASQSQVELIPSSGVFVDAARLSSIPFKKGWSYTLLTRSLMPMVFSKEEMAASCVRGEKATGKGALTSPIRPALNQVKVQAIISFVSSQFPDVQPYQITQTMNQKLVDVRGTIQRKKQVILPVQLKRTSHKNTADYRTAVTP